MIVHITYISLEIFLWLFSSQLAEGNIPSITLIIKEIDIEITIIQIVRYNSPHKSYHHVITTYQSIILFSINDIEYLNTRNDFQHRFQHRDIKSSQVLNTLHNTQYLSNQMMFSKHGQQVVEVSKIPQIPHYKYGRRVIEFNKHKMITKFGNWRHFVTYELKVRMKSCIPLKTHRKWYTAILDKWRKLAKSRSPFHVDNLVCNSLQLTDGGWSWI